MRDLYELVEKRLHEVERALWFRLTSHRNCLQRANLASGYIAGHSFLLWGKCPHELFNKFLGQLAKRYLVSRTTIHRVLGEQIPAVPEGLQKTAT
jgi:hypothetical protein